MRNNFYVKLPFAVIKEDLGNDWDKSIYKDMFDRQYRETKDWYESEEEAMSCIVGDYPVELGRKDLVRAAIDLKNASDCGRSVFLCLNNVLSPEEEKLFDRVGMVG